MVETVTPPPAEKPVVPPVEKPPITPPVEPPKAEEKVPPVKPPEDKKESLLGAAKIVPEKYELKMPDGSPLDKEAITRVENFAKANKLSNEEAQQVLEVENTAVKTFADKQQADMEQTKKTWLDQSTNDKEFGGENLGKNVELSRRVVDKFGSQEFRNALNETGLGNHPELIRMLSRIGKAIGEDELVIGRTGAKPEDKPDVAKKLYPNQK